MRQGFLENKCSPVYGGIYLNCPKCKYRKERRGSRKEPQSDDHKNEKVSARFADITLRLFAQPLRALRYPFLIFRKYG